MPISQADTVVAARVTPNRYFRFYPTDKNGMTGLIRNFSRPL
jgi:hypothetical protein